MKLAVPNFDINDRGTRKLDPKFLLDTGLGSSSGLLTYSASVRLATEMLIRPDHRKSFVNVAIILAISEMQRGVSTRIFPISSNDLTNLQQLQRQISSLP